MYVCMSTWYVDIYKIFGILPESIHRCQSMFNLAFKDSFRLNAWGSSWLLHVKTLFNWFSKSPGRKNALKRLHKVMQTLRAAVTWRMVYPRYYCPTRWLGLHQALMSILNSWDLLVIYANELVTEDGYRPDRRPYASEPQVDELDGEDAANARRDESDDEVMYVHAATFHQWADNSWDLKIGNIENDEDMMTNLELIYLDHDNSVQWSQLPNGVKGKRSKLLSEVKGLTNLNHGIDAMMADILLPHTKLVTRLQTSNIPIAHRVCAWVHEFFDRMNRTFLGDAPTWGRKFLTWRERSKASCTRLVMFKSLFHVGMYLSYLTTPPQPFHLVSQQGFNTLEKQIMVRGRAFTHNFLKSVRRRLQPYWSALMGCELANPCSPSRISPSAWEAVKDLCERVGMDALRADAVV